MSERTDDQIRTMLERAMSNSPQPHPWPEIERRADADRSPRSPAPRRTAVWLAAAACTIALVVGLVVAPWSDDVVRIDLEPVPTTTPATTTPDTTAAPTTTEAPTTSTSTPAAESGWSGGLLDDLDTDALRPLDAYVEGDVIIPTAPSGWRVEDSGWIGDDAESAAWQVTVTEARPGNQFGQVLYVRMSREPTCGAVRGCVPWGVPMTIDDVVWESLVVEGLAEESEEFVANMTVRAGVGDRWVFLQAGAAQLLTGPLLENPPIIEFIEGLRVGSERELAAIGESCWQCDVAGAEGDPFAVPGSPTTVPGDAPTQISRPPQRSPSGVDSDTGRPLTELRAGDVVVPTYIPPGLALRAEAQIHEGPNFSEFSLTLETPDGEYSNGVRLWENGGPIGPADSDDPNHPHVEIAGLTWEWNDFETARIAHVGSFSVWVYLHGLDRSEAERFIEGLRAVTVEQFPGPIAVDGADGVSVINDPRDAELVANDNRFELTAVQSGGQVCTKLEDTSIPATMTFAANCFGSERYAESAIIDLYALDETDTSHLLIGVIDSPSAMAVRLTAPTGESVVVPTGPVNAAIDGRFFLARLVLDISDGIRLDLFTIEDAST